MTTMIDRSYMYADKEFPSNEVGNEGKHDIAFHSYLTGATEQDIIARTEEQERCYCIVREVLSAVHFCPDDIELVSKLVKQQLKTTKGGNNGND